MVGKSLQVDRSDINRDLARIDDPSQSLKLGVHQIANSSQARHSQQDAVGTAPQ
jgi:hypothetical protein